MRGLVALCLSLAVAAVSGCVELVDQEPEAQATQAAAEEAERLLDEYNEKAGHIAGTVTGADGLPIEGATVDLLTVQVAKTDGQGRFTFIDLAPGVYTVVVAAVDHLEARSDVEVAAGQFARPAVQLEAVPAPQPYSTVYRLDGYAEPFSTSFGFRSCYYCSLDGPLDPEGLSEILVEAEMGSGGPLLRASTFEWGLEACSADECTYVNGYDQSPMRFSLLGEDVVAGAEHVHLYIEPYADFLVHFGQDFTAYLTAFYHEGAPEGYSAFDLPEDA